MNLLFVPSVKAEDVQKPYFVVKPNGCGLLAEMGIVIALLDYYEDKWAQDSSGLTVDFGKEGLYYDAKRGSNFWEYYFEPIVIGDKAKGTVRPFTSTEYQNAFHYGGRMSYERANAIIRKYIHVKPFIQKKVDDFYKLHFEGRVILGVHYRGTDKSTEAPRLSYETVYEAVAKEIHLRKKDISRLYLFVASDEQAFIEFMEKKFPGRVLKTSISRSTDGQPLHLKSTTPFETGEGALIDCLLLSRCNFLVRTASNLSHFSKAFNPKLKWKNLHQGERAW